MVALPPHLADRVLDAVGEPMERVRERLRRLGGSPQRFRLVRDVVLLGDRDAG